MASTSSKARFFALGDVVEDASVGRTTAKSGGAGVEARHWRICSVSGSVGEGSKPRGAGASSCYQFGRPKNTKNPGSIIA